MAYNRYTDPPYYITAYGIAVKHGYQGTEEEWIHEIQESAKDSSIAAAASAEAAAGSAASAESDAESAATSEANAGASATAASGSAEDAEAWAVGTRGGEDVPGTDPAYQNNSKYYYDQIGDKTAGAVADWLNEYVDPETGYVIDDSLTVAGAAADAATVGGLVSVDRYTAPETVEWVQGGLSATTGAASSNPARIRSELYFSLPQGYYRLNIPGGFRCVVFCYSTNAVSGYTGRYFPPGNPENDYYIRGSRDIPIKSNYYRFMVAREDGSNITPADVPPALTITRVYVTDPTSSHPGIPADAEQFGIYGVKSSAFDGGTLLSNQTPNTICYLPMSVVEDLEDAPDGVGEEGGYAYLMTIGDAAYPRFQWLISARLTKNYYRIATSRGWRPWFEEDIEASSVIEENLMLPIRSGFYGWYLGRGINGNGDYYDNAGMAVSDLLYLKPGMQLYNGTPDVDDGGISMATFVHTYKAGAWQSRQRLSKTGDDPETPEEEKSRRTFVIPEGIDAVRISFGYAIDAGKTLTREFIADTVSADISFPQGKRNPPVPSLVAIGASTTSAAIHHYSGQSTTRSIYTWPDYTAETLGMNSINLGVGTTGFLARGPIDAQAEAPASRQNFLDVIYSHEDALKKAGVIVLMFGYGNDNSNSTGAHLPIGEYDDYYPYDEEGYHPTGGGASDLDTMVNMGITLMGALNWCIKWCGEHYPHAQFIPVFGAPSSNSDRTVTMTPQEGGEGVAPYKLDFADPYTASGSTNNQRIRQISQELKKLKAALNIPIIDMFFDGGAFTWYETKAMEQFEEDESTFYQYALFSTGGTKSNPVWNSHPNDPGYLRYGREIASRIAALVQYRF